MKHISVLIKPASSLCNLRCSYCFYADISALREVRTYGMMKDEVTQRMIENIFRDLTAGDTLTLAFQGGEPTLAGLNYFKMITALVNAQKKQVQVHYSLQTNGLVINQQWCNFLKEHHFLVGLSLDGFSRYHDTNRVDAAGNGTFHKVLRTKQLFDENGIDYNILCVLTNALAKEPQEVFRFIQQQAIDFIQFIPCLDDLEATKGSTHALTPESFNNFYQNLLSLWLKELKKGRYISIKLFDDIINLLVKRQVTACGIHGNCQIQYVIEADGSVYPCDFYALDDYRMGYIQEKTLRELFETDCSKDFLCSRTHLPKKCLSCPFNSVCRGGCKRMKDAMYVNEETNFCGYQTLLEGFIPQVPKIMERLEGMKR